MADIYSNIGFLGKDQEMPVKRLVCAKRAKTPVRRAQTVKAQIGKHPCIQVMKRWLSPPVIAARAKKAPDTVVRLDIMETPAQATADAHNVQLFHQSKIYPLNLAANQTPAVPI